MLFVLVRFLDGCSLVVVVVIVDEVVFCLGDVCWGCSVEMFGEWCLKVVGLEMICFDAFELSIKKINFMVLREKNDLRNDVRK